MVSPLFVLILLLGALLSLLYARYAQRQRQPARLLALGLVVAAAVYVGFAVIALDLSVLLLETVGLLLFGILASLGIRWFPYWLAIGWLSHVAWDLGLYPVEFSAYSSWWYPVLRTGFDILVAGVIFATYWHRSSAQPIGLSAPATSES